MKLKIVKTGINGEGIGYDNRKPVFVNGCLPNETVDVTITESKEKYCIGELKQVITPSKNRVESVCGLQDKCGSCPLMIASYPFQLQAKRQNLKETLIKYAHYHGKVEDIIPSSKDLYYRNKLNLPVIETNGKLVNALYSQGSNLHISIKECCIHSRVIEKVRKEVLNVLNKYQCKAFDLSTKKGIRQLVIRGFETCQVVLITGNDEINPKIVEDIMNIKEVSSLYQGVNTIRKPVTLMPNKITLLAGTKTIPLKLDNYQFQLQPQAFFQLNYQQALTLYRKLADLVGDKVNTIVEAYCGVGAISMYLHEKAEKIIGCDIEKAAIEDAKFNAELNGISNCEFVCGDASAQVKNIFEENKADVLVVDPPRSGLDEQLLNTLLEVDVPKIIYISCNPATLAKNLNVLRKRYNIKRVIPMDMFPQTVLVETIVTLTPKEK